MEEYPFVEEDSSAEESLLVEKYLLTEEDSSVEEDPSAEESSSVEKYFLVEEDLLVEEDTLVEEAFFSERDSLVGRVLFGGSGRRLLGGGRVPLSCGRRGLFGDRGPFSG